MYILFDLQFCTVNTEQKKGSLGFIFSSCSRQAGTEQRIKRAFFVCNPASTAENCSGDFVTGFGTREVITGWQRDSSKYGKQRPGTSLSGPDHGGGLGVVFSGRNLSNPVIG